MGGGSSGALEASVNEGPFGFVCNPFNFHAQRLVCSSMGFNQAGSFNSEELEGQVAESGRL